MRLPLVCFSLALVCGIPIHAGVFLGTIDCANDTSTPVDPSDNFCAQGKLNDDVTNVNPFAVTHPMGYAGEGGVLNLTVCVSTLMDPDSARLVTATKEAVRIWNELVATTGQCRNCFLVEDPVFPKAPEPFHAASVLLHELGHCALGLDHPNLEFDPPGGADMREQTSFTASYDGSSIGISEGPDGIRGSFDDVQQAAGGMIPDSINWFRIADNNPIVVDGTVIDSTTYSRSVAANLPDGHGWSANGNRDVAASLGFSDTQNVMYTAIARTQRYTGLTADEVNMVNMGMTGEDEIAGTAEDYAINLQFVDDCTNANIHVSFVDIAPPAQPLGGCSGSIDFSFVPPSAASARHYSVVPSTVGDFVFVALNSNMQPWDTSVEIYADGFESGDLSEWDAVVP